MAGELELKWVGKIISLKYEQIFLLHLSLSLSLFSSLSRSTHTQAHAQTHTLTPRSIRHEFFRGFQNDFASVGSDFKDRTTERPKEEERVRKKKGRERLKGRKIERKNGHAKKNRVTALVPVITCLFITCLF